MTSIPELLSLKDILPAEYGTAIFQFYAAYNMILTKSGNVLSPFATKNEKLIAVQCCDELQSSYQILRQGTSQLRSADATNYLHKVGDFMGEASSYGIYSARKLGDEETAMRFKAYALENISDKKIAGIINGAYEKGAKRFGLF